MSDPSGPCGREFIAVNGTEGASATDGSQEVSMRFEVTPADHISDLFRTMFANGYLDRRVLVVFLDEDELMLGAELIQPRLCQGKEGTMVYWSLTFPWRSDAACACIRAASGDMMFVDIVPASEDAPDGAPVDITQCLTLMGVEYWGRLETTC